MIGDWVSSNGSSSSWLATCSSPGSLLLRLCLICLPSSVLLHLLRASLLALGILSLHLLGSSLLDLCDKHLRELYDFLTGSNVVWAVLGRVVGFVPKTLQSGLVLGLFLVTQCWKVPDLVGLIHRWWTLLCLASTSLLALILALLAHLRIHSERDGIEPGARSLLRDGSNGMSTPIIRVGERYAGRELE